MLAVLQHYINVFRVVKVAVQLDYVWVVESPLYFKLSFHLTEEIKLLEHMLEDHFQGDGNTRTSLNGLKNFAKLPTANRLDACEIVYFPAFSLLRRAIILVLLGCDLCHFKRCCLPSKLS